MDPLKNRGGDQFLYAQEQVTDYDLKLLNKTDFGYENCDQIILGNVGNL